MLILNINEPLERRHMLNCPWKTLFEQNHVHISDNEAALKYTTFYIFDPFLLDTTCFSCSTLTKMLFDCKIILKMNLENSENLLLQHYPPPPFSGELLL